MVAQAQRRFVYGRFSWPGKDRKLPELPSHPWLPTASSWDPVALEILREYSANEFLGKLHVRGPSGNWVPAEASKIANFEWYKWYERIPADVRARGKALYFEMEGSGKWKILHIRNESDDTGPYVAVAVQYGAG